MLDLDRETAMLIADGAQFKGWWLAMTSKYPGDVMERIFANLDLPTPMDFSMMAIDAVFDRLSELSQDHA